MGSLTGKTMRALQIIKDGANASLKVVTVPVPTATKGNVLVKVHASLINSSDMANSLGMFPFTTFPRIPGRDFAGTVESGPAELVGKRVFGTSGSNRSFTEDGAHAEYLVIPEKEVVEIPSNLSFEQAATIGVPYTTALVALQRAQPKESDTILVLGASGAVGSAAVQIAEAKGHKVFTASRGDKTDINLTSDPELSKVKELTDGKGPNIIVDTVGNPTLMRAGLEILGQGGRYTYMAAPPGNPDMTYNMKKLYTLSQSIVGSIGSIYDSNETQQLIRELGPDFASGKLIPKQEAEFTKVKLGEDALAAYWAMKKKEPGRFLIVM
jgi:NADPH2:quinone reductase